MFDALEPLGIERGAWSPETKIHTVKALNMRATTQNLPPEKVQIELIGGVPIGKRKDGRPKFGKRQDDVRAVITLAEYKEVYAVAKATGQ